MLMMLGLFVPGFAVTKQISCGSGSGDISCASALDEPKSSALLQHQEMKSHMFVSEETEGHQRREEDGPKADHDSGDGSPIDVLFSEKQEGLARRDENGPKADHAHGGNGPAEDSQQVYLDQLANRKGGEDGFTGRRRRRKATSPSQALPSNYVRMEKACVNGNNIVKIPDKSVANCAGKCDEDPACKAFEYGVAYGGSGNYQPRDCQLQSLSDPTGCDGARHNLDLYIKEAATPSPTSPATPTPPATPPSPKPSRMQCRVDDRKGAGQPCSCDLGKLFCKVMVSYGVSAWCKCS